MEYIIYNLTSNNFIFDFLKNSSCANIALRRILQFLTCLIIRFHLTIIISNFFRYNTTINFFLDLFIDISLSFLNEIIYNFILKYDEVYISIANYFIKNYSRENYIIWKRYTYLLLLSYFIVALFLIEVNNNILILILIRCAISFLIWESIERKIVQNFLSKKIENRKLSRISKVNNFNDIEIVNDFLNKSEEPKNEEINEESKNEKIENEENKIGLEIDEFYLKKKLK